MVGQGGTKLEHWNQLAEQVCGRFSTRFALNQALFVGDIRREQFGGTDIAFIRTNASQIVRARSNADREEDRFCFLVLQQQGSMEVSLGADRMKLREGDLALLDPADSIEMVPSGLFKHMSVHLPREAIKGISRKGFGKLSTGGLSGQLLRNMMLQLASGELSRWQSTEEGAGTSKRLSSSLGTSRTLRFTFCISR